MAYNGLIYLGALSPSIYGANNATIFAPKKGVVIKNGDATGFIATASAVAYLDQLRESVALLEVGNWNNIADEAGVSREYASEALLQLLESFRWQAQFLEAAREVFVGVVTNGDGRFFAIGRRIIDQKKESALAKLRSTLPVAPRNMYILKDDATIYRVPSTTKKGVPQRTSITIGELKNKDDVHRPHFIFIHDSPMYRKYAGRTLLTNKKVWQDWFGSGLPENTTVYLLTDGDGISSYSPEELWAYKPKDLYEKTGKHYNFQLSVLLEKLKFLTMIYPAGITATVYITDAVAGNYEFCSALGQWLAEMPPLRLQFMRFGRYGYNEIRRMEWRLGYGKKSISYDMTNRRLREVGHHSDHSWLGLVHGIGVNPNKVVTLTPSYTPMTAEQVAEAASAPLSRVLMGPVSKMKHNNPPYLYSIGGAAILSTGGEIGTNAIACAVPENDETKYTKGTYFYFFESELRELLANT